MGGIYYVDMVDVARAAGVVVDIPAVCQGWETRARSSGGFPSPPLGVWWHHTASSTSPLNDLSWMIDGCPDAPVGNWLVDRDGVCYPIAAGASNCAGQGGPAVFSRGTCPADAGNTRGWQLEIACDGVGGPYSVEALDAAFRLSNALNAHVGNLPTDVITHAIGVGDGWTDRKIDPATATAVAGLWTPAAVNSSGTWSLDDLAAECFRRATVEPPPELPEPPEEDDVGYPIAVIGAVDRPDQPAIAAGIGLYRPVSEEERVALVVAGLTRDEIMWLNGRQCDLLGTICTQPLG